MARTRIALVFVVLLALAGLWWFSRTMENPRGTAPKTTGVTAPAPATPATPSSNPPAPPVQTPHTTKAVANDPAVATGIPEPVASAKPAAAATPAAADPTPKSPGDYGSFPPIPAETLKTNAQAKSVAEALRTNTHPERLSPLIAPTPFDEAQWQADPAQYLAVSEPGRIWQVKQPGEGVPVLARLTPSATLVRQGQTSELQVRTAAKGAVTFTVFDGGVFTENRLPSLSVQADAQGVATATYLATPGVTNRVHIQAGSPQASGTVKFTVTVDTGTVARTASADPVPVPTANPSSTTQP